MADDPWTRSEIRGFQSAQAEVLKWKFVVCGATAAVGFGLLSEQTKGSVLSLAALPWIAWYADSLYRDYDLRIGTLTAFIRGHHAESWQYECFLMDDTSVSNFWMSGAVAVALPTLFLCICVCTVGGLGLSGKLSLFWSVPWQDTLVWWSLIVSGAVALIAAVAAVFLHARIYERMNTRAKELSDNLAKP